MTNEELDKLPASPYGRGLRHSSEEIPVAIRGYRCYIDRKIVDLVKNLNEFKTKDGRRPYNTIASCQETRIVGRAGGSVRIIMKPLKGEDITNLNKIIEETFLDLSIKEKEYTINGKKRENSGMNCDVKSYSHEEDNTQSLVIDCSVDRDIKGIFEKRRKDFTDSMNNSLKKLSGKV